ncbi:MAG: hypothetical protein K5945_09795 [Bacteroidaceae bacterium]|nr:hypothetical protein [Bacteroidaceae bacterium]
MKKMNFWLLASLFLGSVMLTACGDDDDGSSSDLPTPSGKVDLSKTGGTVSLKQKSGQEVASITVPAFSTDNLSGVEIVDNELTMGFYTSDETADGYSYCSLSVVIPGYSESKTSYSNLTLNFSQGQNSQYFQGSSVYYVNGEPKSGRLSATVKKQKDGNYSVAVEGDVYLTGSEIRLTDENPNGTIKINIVAPLLAVSKLHKKVSSKQSYFPAGTPWLDGKTAAGVLETKSAFTGNGVLVWYYGTKQTDGSYDLNYAQYEALKAQAVKAMGEPFECFDASTVEVESGSRGTTEWSDFAYAYFYKNKKYMMVSYCPWRDTYEGEEPSLPYTISALHENHAARLQVHVMENMNVDYKQFVFSMR